ncbi:MAG: leucine-rich repeat domain-containing protein [Acutalibacteraceae bacterium]
MKSIKKLISVMLTVLLLVNLIPASVITVSADSQVLANNGDYTCSIYTGIDGNEYLSIIKYNGSNVTQLTIPSTVNVNGESYDVYDIGDGSNPIATNLKTVRISEGIQVINAYAFYECSGLYEVYLPQSLTAIGARAFENCKDLELVHILSNINISNNAFYECDNVIFDAKDTDLPRVAAFAERNGISIISYSDSNFYAYNNILIKYIGASASVPSFSTLDGKIIDTISRNAFKGTDITQVTIPDSVTTIKDYAFADCKYLKTIELKETVKTFGDGVFSGCDALVILGEKGTYNSANEYIPTAPEAYAIRNSISFATEKNTSFCIYDSTSTDSTNTATLVKYIGTSTVVPDFSRVNNKTITVIGRNAFKGTGITSLTIPSSVTKIEAYAFDGCTGMQSITIPDTVEYIDQNAFYGCNDLVIIGSEDSEAQRFATDNGYMFATSKTNDYYYYVELIKDINSDGTEYIKDRTLTLIKYIGSQTSGNITLPSSISGYRVAKAGNNLFNGASGFSSITIPYSIVNIGDYAFNNCINVKINIQGELLNIGKCAFNNCNRINDTVIFADGATVAEKSFYECTSLKTIIMPNTTSIGSSVFYGCTSMEAYYYTLNYDEGTATINRYEKASDRSYTQVPDIICDHIVTVIGNNAFYKLPLTKVVLPEFIEIIGSYAFNGCSELTEITIPLSVTQIDKYAFSGCTGLKSLYISNSLTTIGEKVFSGCNDLVILGVANSPIHQYAISAGIIFATSMSGDYYYYVGENNTATLVKYIGNVSAGAISLPAIIGTYKVTAIGDNLFKEYSELTAINIPDSIDIIGAYAFYNCTNVDISYSGTISSVGKYAFYNCKKFSGTIVFNTNAKQISERAFEGCTGLTTVILPSSVSVVSSAFSGCTNSEKYYYTIDSNSAIINKFEQSPRATTQIPTQICGKNVTEISSNVFNKKTSLTNIEIPDTIEKIGDGAFAYCTGLTYIDIPGSLKNIGINAFYNCYNAQFNITNPIESLGERAFYNCRGLTGEVTFASGADRVPANAFYGCSKLTSVKLSSTVISICESAFANCISLKDIVLPDSIAEIGASAFNGCASLTGITIPKNMKKISDYTFANCSGLTEINMHSGITEIATYAFNNCTNLKSVELPKGISIVDIGTFAGCLRLERFVVYQPKITIKRDAFTNCPSLIIYGTEGGDAQTYANTYYIPFMPIVSYATIQAALTSGAELTPQQIDEYDRNGDSQVNLLDAYLLYIES